MGNKPKDKSVKKEVNYNEMFYRQEQEIKLTGEQFMTLKDMINRATINRTRLVFRANGSPIGRTEVGYENEDIRELNTLVDSLHKTFVDGGQAIHRDVIMKELEEEKNK